MEYFLQLFGEVSIGWVVVLIAALLFLAGCYRKAEKYFSDKAIRENENHERIQKVIEQAENYPKWRQQSIDVRDHLNGSIDSLGKKLDDVNDAIKELRRENGEDRALTCRYRILRFDDEIRHDVKHTKEHFDQILEDITEYERYCGEHPDYKNNKAVLATQNIKRIYQSCTNEGTFL